MNICYECGKVDTREDHECDPNRVISNENDGQ